MEQTVNIADLVRSKFEAGQRVFVVSRDSWGYITGIRPAVVTKVVYKVVSEWYDTASAGGYKKKSAELFYLVTGDPRPHKEDQLIASLAELPEADREPRLK